MLGVTVIRGHHWNALMAPRAEQGPVCPPGGLGGRWRWTLATFEVSAFSRRRVSELGGPAAAYQTLLRDKATLCFFFFFHCHKDRLLMRLQSPSSDLTLGLLCRVSARTAETLSVCSRFCNARTAQRDFETSFFFWGGLRFLRIYLKRQPASVMNEIFFDCLKCSFFPSCWRRNVNFFTASQIWALNIDEPALISYGVNLSPIKDVCWCFSFHFV